MIKDTMLVRKDVNYVIFVLSLEMLSVWHMLENCLLSLAVRAVCIGLHRCLRGSIPSTK